MNKTAYDMCYCDSMIQKADLRKSWNKNKL